MMSTLKKRILNHDEITHKIRRITYQIYEANVNEIELIIAGVDKNGYLLAEEIKQQLDVISDINSQLCLVKINKSNLTAPVTTSLSEEAYTNKSIVLVDDVLNSGGTLIYGIKHFLEVPLKRFKTAVLVNRNHKRYPVKADFKGISLSTSLLEHVEVNLSEAPFEAYLN